VVCGLRIVTNYWGWWMGER